MRANICPVCKTKFYDERYMESDFTLLDECAINKNSKQRPVRTSTPVAELVYNPTSSVSDSVTDFFYQTWKSGLHTDNTSSARHSSQRHQQFTELQPMGYPPQVVYINTVIFQPYIPTSYVQQQVGYRPDGTFGVLPTYWS